MAGAQVPKGFRVQETSDALILRRRWLEAGSVVFIAFVAGWTGFGWFLWARAEAPLVMIMITVGSGACLSYLAVAGVVNVTEITVSGGRLRVRHGPLPWPGRLDVSTADLRQLHLHEGAGERSLRVLRRDGTAFDLLRGISVKPEEARFIEKKVEGYLGLRDVPMPGEPAPGEDGLAYANLRSVPPAGEDPRWASVDRAPLKYPETNYRTAAVARSPGVLSVGPSGHAKVIPGAFFAMAGLWLLGTCAWAISASSLHGGPCGMSVLSIACAGAGLWVLRSVPRVRIDGGRGRLHLGRMFGFEERPLADVAAVQVVPAGVLRRSGPRFQLNLVFPDGSRAQIMTDASVGWLRQLSREIGTLSKAPVLDSVHGWENGCAPPAQD